MEPSPPDTAQRRAVVACALAVAASGCTLIDAELTQGRYWVLFLASAVFAFLVFASLTAWAWHRAFEAWEHPNPARPGLFLQWLPHLIVVGVVVGFALDVLFSPPLAEMPPGEEWTNVGNWLLGSVVGSFAGWILGKYGTGRRLNRLPSA